jgi:hypothetical protein
MLFLFYPVNLQIQLDVFGLHTMCFRDLRVSYTAERIASDSCYMCRLEENSFYSEHIFTIFSTEGKNYFL